MATVFLGLGSNIGNKVENLNKAIDFIRVRIGEIISSSAFYETKPWGYVSENTFLNAVVLVETNILPLQTLTIIQEIEREMGRRITSENDRYEDRIIDIDLLFYDDLIYSDHILTVPHPLIEKREFILNPLAEIAPNFVHPVSKKTMLEVKKELLLEEKEKRPSYIKLRLKSFKYAFNGIKVLLKNEHNARIHLFAGVLVILLGILLRVSLVEWMLLTILIGVVFMTEIFNTIIEYMIDYISPTYRNQVKKIKDLGAAAVLIVAFSAVILGLMIFIPKIYTLIN